MLSHKQIFIILVIIICIILFVTTLLYNNILLHNKESFTVHYNDIAPILPDKYQSQWDYYGNYNNYLMDGLTSGHGNQIKYETSIPPYCDIPNRNRSYLVNPLLTQKHIFIKPNIDGFDKNVVPDFGNSAEAIRIGAFEELMVPQNNYFYDNFTRAVKNPEELQKYKESYIQRCGLFKNDVPRNTFTNPY